MKDTEINERTERVEEIIETLETGDIELEKAARLRAEAHELLDELEEHLAVGDGEVAVLTDN